MKHSFTWLLFLLTWVMPLRTRSDSGPPNKQTYSAYLFAYFTGNDKKDEAIRFALSSDGYHYTALNGNRPVVSSAAISVTGGVRDPHILRGVEGKTFYMVVTDMVSANAGIPTGVWCCSSPPICFTGRPTPLTFRSAIPASKHCSGCGPRKPSIMPKWGST